MKDHEMGRWEWESRLIEYENENDNENKNKNDFHDSSYLRINFGGG